MPVPPPPVPVHLCLCVPVCACVCLCPSLLILSRGAGSAHFVRVVDVAVRIVIVGLEYDDIVFLVIQIQRACARRQTIVRK